ncbi:MULTISPECIES: 6,7-dimethyl-8-ribityllumazine synthase [Dactylosporangium]|uniref:6,7-dimethyl-8-ribityllumazine synthase n=2 Tax=Dactylosporangium TaxID=35753 RepID=A0A9W6KPT4_9ACTN|nr:MULTISPECIES: 6,7-dimethyl-8-ribityllumazine synthase [Dactylosporangium]UAB94628.1 6,7-dimethyl-8-ribityllumazine synthase [Dactylosporangium vinaceum]UWZ42997.1 6,7-dimethyl-8-ribityllumazine synthase [Dactylosporangium matsuzakiense]GLL03324.1 6,7-dimethyl-8-ribityllumazine synthase [Dactylosporangium matsuzakiense]
MAGIGAPVLQRVDGTGLTLGIVATRWHAELVDHMLNRAIEAGEASNVDHITVARVDGAVELPVLAQALAHRFDAVVALGVVIRGDTAHFDYVCQSVTDGLTRVALDENTPVAHGVLTVESFDQARARAGFPDSAEDKGYGATLAALDAAVALRLVAKS